MFEFLEKMLGEFERLLAVAYYIETLKEKRKHQQVNSYIRP